MYIHFNALILIWILSFWHLCSRTEILILGKNWSYLKVEGGEGEGEGEGTENSNRKRRGNMNTFLDFTFIEAEVK